MLGESRPPEAPGEATGAGVPEPRVNGPRPEIVQSLVLPRQLSGDVNVVGTNIALAAATMVTILLTATMFNQTVQENSDSIERFLGRFLAPLRGAARRLGRVFDALSGSGGGLAAVAGPVAVLALTALVYGFAEPGFGLNDKSFVLVASLVFGVGAVTYTYSGGQALVSSRGHGIPGGVRLFPAGLAIAVVSVLISRVEDFQPGIIYGFIASFAVFGAAALNRRQLGHVVFFPGLGLLVLSVIAWLLVDPFRDLARDHEGSVLAAVPEAVAAAIFVGGLEGLFFNMVPVEFMDGKKLWDWNKAAWAVMTLLTAFLFWHVLLNTEKSYFSALQQAAPLTAVLLLAICAVMTSALWMFFKLRQPSPAS